MDPRGRKHGNLGYFSHEAARDNPDGTAVIDLSRTPARTVTYRELERRLDQVASLLTAAGVRPGERLAMCVGNRFEFVEIMFGMMRAGIVPVPLNTRLSGDVISYILSDSGSRGAIVEPATNRFVTGIVEDLALPVRFSLDLQLPGWNAWEPQVIAAEPGFDAVDIDGDHLAFLPYTSGSTGHPKGVPLTHRGQMWWIHTVQRHWPSSASRPRACRHAALSQERDGRGHQADAARRRLGGSPAGFRARAVHPHAQCVWLHPRRRCPRRRFP